MLENINDIIERIFAELEYDRDRNNENRDLVRVLLPSYYHNLILSLFVDGVN